MKKFKSKREIRESYFSIIMKLFGDSEKDERTNLAVSMVMAASKSDLEKAKELIDTSKKYVDHDQLYEKMKKRWGR